MPHRFNTAIAIALFLSFAFSSCSYTTAQGRREAAYRRYVNQHVRERQKMMANAQNPSKHRLKFPLKFPHHVKDPIVTNNVEPVERGGPMILAPSKAGDTAH